ncbi:hypothetical protein PQX77_014121 [Marasmius sp. AFHP31]|nr:hypothetical protein PQX77_014121 [Marasmius sp. AFHP31]
MTTQHVEVLNLPGKFTSIAVEAMEEGQAEDLKTIPVNQGILDIFYLVHHFILNLLVWGGQNSQYL